VIRFARWVPLVSAGASVLLGAPAAVAAAPPNDARAAAQALGPLPASVRGTTVQATLEAAELTSGCAATKNSVWYGFTAAASRSILIALDASGDLDASIDVYQRERSQVTPVTCKNTNRRGAATIDIDASRGADYLIRVGARENSADAGFSLRVVVPDAPASFPGKRLPRTGVRAVVDRLANADDAWAIKVQRGRTYRLNLVSSGARCATAELYDGADSFGSDPIRRLRCDATRSSCRRRRAPTASSSGRRAPRAIASRTGSAPASRRRTTRRRAFGSPTTRGCAAASTAASSTRSTSTASRSPGRAFWPCASPRAGRSTCGC
jgi:hypothetical protein